MMNRPSQLHEIAATFVGLVGSKAWATRMSDLGRGCTDGQRTGRALIARHAIEVAIERLRRGGSPDAPTSAERAIAAMAEELIATSTLLAAMGRRRLRERLLEALSGDGTLVGLFHLARIAAMQRARGFAVQYAGLADAAPFDLLVSRQGVDAELLAEVISAEDGRDLHRGAWVRLVDRIDPDLQTWLAAHPGRYLLKLTLPQGLRTWPSDQGRLASLHARIRTMLEGQRRADYDEAAVLRLDPLILAGAQAGELGLMNCLRQEFGHEAHLAVTAAQGSVFVMAARAGREDEVAVAMRRRMAAVAPVRLTGTRPGILAVMIDDTDRLEWRHLRDRLILEGEARQFLTLPEARSVVAVTCSSRLELFGDATEDAVAEGELRFRNPSHPAAKAPGLAPAVASTL